jgi:hypothetical protein
MGLGFTLIQLKLIQLGLAKLHLGPNLSLTQIQVIGPSLITCLSPK